MSHSLPTKIINLDKKKCCGCSACAQICPKQCISMVEDAEGFLYPFINVSECIGCLKCEKVCFETNQIEAKKPLYSFAAINSESEVRNLSSSGGTFYFLACKVLSIGGVVFGARFDDEWNVVHDVITEKKDIHLFMGSKYVQSRIDGSYTKCKNFLTSNRIVLFTGTPCQIAGLKRYLGRDYDNLITLDIICHGVPSPMVWRKYLHEISNNREIVNVHFRDKRDGWYNYRVTFNFKNGEFYSCKYIEDPYMQLFLNDYTLRPSCYNCSSKCGRAGSDLTLGDFWGVDKIMPSMYDGKGTGLVLVSTEKGRTLLLESCSLVIQKVDYSKSILYNKAYCGSYTKPLRRELLFKKLNKKSIKSLYTTNLRPEYLLKNKLKNKIKKLLFIG